MNCRLLVAHCISKRVVQLLGSAKKLANPRTLLCTSAKNSCY